MMTDQEILSRLILSLLCGVAVGVERQWHHKTAGLKTNSLVALGATAFGLIATQGLGPNGNPAQIAAAVVSGIGFIGGGVIIRHGGSVQGVNSAATLWVTAGVGLSLGVGYYRLALATLGLVLCSQFLLRRLSRWIDQRSDLILAAETYRVSLRYAPEVAGQVRVLWDGFAQSGGVRTVSYQEANPKSGETSLEIRVNLSALRTGELTKLSRSLTDLGVKQADWSQEESENDE